MSRIADVVSGLEPADVHYWFVETVLAALAAGCLTMGSDSHMANPGCKLEEAMTAVRGRPMTWS